MVKEIASLLHRHTLPTLPRHKIPRFTYKGTTLFSISSRLGSTVGERKGRIICTSLMLVCFYMCVCVSAQRFVGLLSGTSISVLCQHTTGQVGSAFSSKQIAGTRFFSISLVINLTSVASVECLSPIGLLWVCFVIYYYYY